MSVSPTGIIPEELIQPGKRVEVIAWLTAQPLQGLLKVRLLKGWARTVGARLTSPELQTVHDSGIDTGV